MKKRTQPAQPGLFDTLQPPPAIVATPATPPKAPAKVKPPDPIPPRRERLLSPEQEHKLQRIGSADPFDTKPGPPLRYKWLVHDEDTETD